MQSRRKCCVHSVREDDTATCFIGGSGRDTADKARHAADRSLGAFDSYSQSPLQLPTTSSGFSADAARMRLEVAIGQGRAW